MDLASQMILFARVVDTGSFSRAARALEQSPSAVSRQIGHLEDRVGVRLLNRTQQGISLTEEGRAFHERCRAVAREVANAEESLATMGALRGTLRIVSTVAFGKAQLLPLLPAFLDAYPELRLNLELTDRPVDLAAEDVDVAIRFSEQIADPTVIARKLAPNRRVICAAPAYVERFGAPQTPEDLARHNCLGLTTVTAWNDWVFDDRGGETLRVSGNFEANSADAIYHAALAGVGIARLSTYLVQDDLRAGRLVRLLPHYVQENSNIVAIYADRRNLAPKIRVFLDFLVGHFAGVPPWEREAA
ncbi:DNA-binding transcriptional regulator, LysR family [Limimonas halophila]|uniref:DNA-binding transcriptional regulator, LysR family n=1 Tax=Limimonas halophila TaxID=1082479 RepID=A0A1G7QGT8_9PROT|nr:LysR family transcriptional regulator [Limimonas halophila]SDF97753.1 DNA-binding transcriptional regulator, LysR family [Limimonas halophila]